jgi:hypothetical protein
VRGARYELKGMRSDAPHANYNGATVAGICAKFPFWQLKGITSCHSGNSAYLFKVRFWLGRAYPGPSPGQHKQLCKRKGGLWSDSTYVWPRSHLPDPEMGPYMRP